MKFFYTALIALFCIVGAQAGVYVPGRANAVLQHWLNSLPHDESQYLRHNRKDKLDQLASYLSELFLFCDNPININDESCQNGFVPNPGVVGDLTTFSAVAGSTFDPTRQVVYTIPKFNADTIPGFNVTAYNPTFNDPGTGTTNVFKVFYTGDRETLEGNADWPTLPIAYNSIPPFGPVPNRYFTAPNVGFHVPYNSLPITEGVKMQPVLWAIGSCQYGNDYRASVEYHASRGRAVIMPETIPGICTNFNGTDFNHNFAIDYLQIVEQVYAWSLPGSGNVLSGHIDWSRPILLGHSEGNVQLMMLLAGNAANQVPRFSLLADADTLFLPRDPPADNIDYASLQNTNVKLHGYVSGQRGLGEMSFERLSGANRDQYYNDFHFFQPVIHETFAVSEQHEAIASIASGNCVNSPFWAKSCSYIYPVANNATLTGSIVDPDVMSVFTNKFDEIYIQCWQVRKNPLYCMYLDPPYMDFQMAKIANPRRPGYPAAQYVVPRTTEPCPVANAPPGVCVYSADNTTNGIANRPAFEWISDWEYYSASYWSSKEQAEEYWVDQVIDMRSYPRLLLPLYYDGHPPVWPKPFQPLANLIQDRWDQYTPWEITNWFA